MLCLCRSGVRDESSMTSITAISTQDRGRLARTPSTLGTAATWSGQTAPSDAHSAKCMLGGHYLFPEQRESLGLARPVCPSPMSGNCGSCWRCISHIGRHYGSRCRRTIASKRRIQKCRVQRLWLRCETPRRGGCRHSRPRSEAKRTLCDGVRQQQTGTSSRWKGQSRWMSCDSSTDL